MRIGVFTSGGDAPGMNACIRAVVRTALPRGHEVIGIRRGTRACWTKTSIFRSTGTIIRCTFAASRISSIAEARSSTPAAASDSRPRKACRPRPRSCDGIESTTWWPSAATARFAGAIELAHYWDGRVIGCPGTIDNDLSGTDVSIGFTSAVSTAAEAVDKIRDTADATERLFLVEVMGRHSGQIAMHTALATGADAALIPEVALPSR